MKYELTDETNGSGLRRIRALRDIPSCGVKEGDLGGWVESEGNLTQEGDCWVFDDARVSGNARVFDDAQVFGNARVFGKAMVFGNAQVFDNARVFDNAMVFGNAQVFNAAVCGGGVTS